MDMDQFRTLVAVSVAVASTNNPGLGAQLPYIYDAINTVGEGPNTLQEWVDATNTYLEEDARLEVDNLRNIGDRDLEVILMSDMRPTQQHTGKELGAAHKKVAEALERYIGASKMTGVLKNLDQTIPQGSSYEETSARLEELGKPQFELLLNQKKESIPVNTKLSGEPTKHDKVAILELEKLPTNFEKAVQEALANPEISYEQIKQLLYPHSSFALQIDGNRKRTWMEYIFRW